MAGAVEAENDYKATGEAVDRREAAFFEASRGDMRLVVKTNAAGHLNLPIILIGPEPRDRHERLSLIVVDQQAAGGMGADNDHLRGTGVESSPDRKRIVEATKHENPIEPVGAPQDATACPRGDERSVDDEVIAALLAKTLLPI